MQMYFHLLEKIIHDEKSQIETEIQTVEMTEFISSMGDIECSVLRYVSGAAVHNVSKKLKESAQNHMISDMNKARIEYKSSQLMSVLRIPAGYAMDNSDDPESLMEIVCRQHLTQSLTFVSDDAFQFFKVLYCKVKTYQSTKELEKHNSNLLQVCKSKLQKDENLLEMWCNLFNQIRNRCSCSADIDSTNGDQQSMFNSTLIDYELEQSLVLDLYERILHYFCTVHFSDKLDKYKDSYSQRKGNINLPQITFRCF